MKLIYLIKNLVKKSKFYDEKKDKKILKSINEHNIRELIKILIKLLNDNRYRESILKIFIKTKQIKGGNNNNNNNRFNDIIETIAVPIEPVDATVATPIAVPIEPVDATVVAPNSVPLDIYMSVTADLQADIFRLEQELYRVLQRNGSQSQSNYLDRERLRRLEREQILRRFAENESVMLRRRQLNDRRRRLFYYMFICLGLIFIIYKYVILPTTNNVNTTLTQENVINALEYNNENGIITQIYEELIEHSNFISRLRSGVNNSPRNNLGGKSKKKHKKIKRRRKTKKRYNKK